MSNKLAALADRIKRTKASLDACADELGARLDEMDKVAPDTFERAHTFLKMQEVDVQALEDGLRQLSNLPLDGQDNSQKGLDDA